jgi:hypothetical protein
MLNINDRKALKRNRNGVSWLTFLCVILFIWIKMIYGNIETYSNNNNELRYELNEAQKLCIDRKKTIDSLMNVINYKHVDTTKLVVKPTHKQVKKDSLFVKSKVDTSKSESKDIILKDTVK